MKIGCLFGSFNPIHSGHINLANIVFEKTNMEEIWFIISPQNPFKINKRLIDDDKRLEMVKLMIDSNPKFKSSNIEFRLTKPSYTYKTINELTKEYPYDEFNLIIGSDALNDIKKWNNYKDVIKLPIITTIRGKEQLSEDVIDIIDNLTIVKSPLTTSSTFVREQIRCGNIDNLLKLKLINMDVINYIKYNELYQFIKHF